MDHQSSANRCQACLAGESKERHHHYLFAKQYHLEKLKDKTFRGEYVGRLYAELFTAEDGINGVFHEVSFYDFLTHNGEYILKDGQVVNPMLATELNMEIRHDENWRP